MTNRENYLRAVRFEKPDFIPMSFHINPACFDFYEQDALFELLESHSFLFPDFERPEGIYRPEFSPITRSAKPFLDDFGCLWKTACDGLVGTVVQHPLNDWDDFPNWMIPDPEICSGIGPLNWVEQEKNIREKREKGELCSGGLRHGHTFLQLSDLRGYQELIFDFADEEPLIWKLLEQVEQFNMGIIRRYLEIGVDVMMYPEDLGMQKGPMVSPGFFRKYIKPSYQRMMKPARDQGVLIHMHSDGDLHDLIDDIIDGGVDIINLQDLVNGVDWIAGRFKGKTCVDLDIDRQNITVFGSPRDVEEMIAQEVKTIGSPQGGLMMVFGMYPGMPLENAKALMDAMEKYAYYYN